MSLLHLLGCDDDLSLDGKGLDKTICDIRGYADNEEDNIDSANGILSDILSCVKSIDPIENISNNVDDLVEAADNLLHSSISIYKTLKNISSLASDYCEVDNKQHIQDLLHCLAEEAEDGMLSLNQELSIEIEPKVVFGSFGSNLVKYCNFDFIPDSAILNRSDKSGLVCYVSGDWEFELSTYIGYGGLRMTPKTFRYKHIDFCKIYDKIIEVGLDQNNISVEDYQLLKILDSGNVIVYNLFVKDK